MNIEKLIDFLPYDAVKELIKAAALNGELDAMPPETVKSFAKALSNGKEAKVTTVGRTSKVQYFTKAKSNDSSKSTRSKKSAVDQEALVKLATQKGALSRSVVISRFACSGGQASSALAKAVEDGALFAAGSRRWTRYATTQKAADAALEKE